MFRDRAQPRRADEDLDRPLRLVSVPAVVGLAFALLVIAAGALWLFGGHVAVRVPASGVIVNPPANVDVVSATAGVITKGPLLLGRRVEAGTPVATVTAPDGTATTVRSPLTGTIVSRGLGVHDAVAPGDNLVTVAPATAPMIGRVFAPATTVPGIATGDPVVLQPVSADPSSTGSLRGTVREVTPLPVSPQRVESLVTDPQLTEQIAAGGVPVHEITVELALVPDSTDLQWTGPGPSSPPVSGEIVSAEIVIAEQTPWQALLGGSGG